MWLSVQIQDTVYMSLTDPGLFFFLFDNLVEKLSVEGFKADFWGGGLIGQSIFGAFPTTMWVFCSHVSHVCFSPQNNHFKDFISCFLLPPALLSAQTDPPPLCPKLWLLWLLATLTPPQCGTGESDSIDDHTQP